jgi:hypothetical protein
MVAFAMPAQIELRLLAEVFEIGHGATSVEVT